MGPAAAVAVVTKFTTPRKSTPAGERQMIGGAAGR
jgi:hypothetical protein